MFDVVGFVAINTMIVGLAIPAFEQASAQRRAVASIRAEGGSVAFEHQLIWTNDAVGRISEHRALPLLPWWKRLVMRYVDPDLVRTIRSVYLSQDASKSRRPGRTWSAVSTLSTLHVAFLDGDDIDDAHFRDLLRHNPELRILVVRNGDVTSAGLEALKFVPGLQHLVMESAKVDDEGLRLIAKCPRLKSLSLESSTVSETGLGAITSMKELIALNLTSTNAGDRAIASLKGSSRIEEIELESTRITDESLKDLAEMRNLKKIRLNHTKITAKELEHLTKLENVHTLIITAPP